MKRVLITGVAGGLGSCLAEEFIRKAYFVFGFDKEHNDKSGLLETEYAGRFEFFQVDTGQDKAVENAAEMLKKKIDSLDIIINAAAILPPNSANLLEDFDISQAIEVFSVNSLGPLRIVKSLLPLVKNGEDKLIVNISSEAGSMSTHCDYINRYDYCMSKAALNMQSIILQRYLKPDGIKVLAVHPGWVRTRMGGGAAPVLPGDSARGIVKLADKYMHDLDAGIYFDYDGNTRSW